jgi:hypothetical protein
MVVASRALIVVKHVCVAPRRITVNQVRGRQVGGPAGEEVALDEPDRETGAFDIAGGDGERVGIEIESDHAGVGEGVLERNREAGAADPDLGNEGCAAVGGGKRASRGEHRVDEVGKFGVRDVGTLVDEELASAKEEAAGDVGDRLAREPALEPAAELRRIRRGGGERGEIAGREIGC